jgi:hypothetical protein
MRQAESDFSFVTFLISPIYPGIRFENVVLSWMFCRRLHSLCCEYESIDEGSGTWKMGAIHCPSLCLITRRPASRVLAQGCWISRLESNENLWKRSLNRDDERKGEDVNQSSWALSPVFRLHQVLHLSH